MLVQIQLKAGECVSPMRLFCARLAKVENLKNNWFVMVKHRFWCCPFLATPIWVAHPQLGSIIFCTRIWVGKRLKIQLDWLQYASFWTAFAKCELAVWSLFEFFKKSVSVIFSHYVTSFNCGNKSHWFIKMRVVKLQPLRVFDAHRHHVDCSWNHKVSLKIHEMRAWPRQKKCQYGQVLVLGLIGLHYWRLCAVWTLLIAKTVPCDPAEPTRVLQSTPGFDIRPKRDLNLPHVVYRALLMLAVERVPKLNGVDWRRANRCTGCVLTRLHTKMWSNVQNAQCIV